MQTIQRGAARRLCRLCTLLLLVPGPTQAATAACDPGWPAREVSIERAIDGDTLKLTDGRSLRLVGLDTPELGRDGSADAPFAQAALDFTTDWLSAAQRPLQLNLAEDPEDGYGRLLGSLYDARGERLDRALLSAGLAIAYAYPPNHGVLACADGAESSARAAGRGLWSDAGPLRDVSTLGDDEGGFMLLRGRITRRLNARDGGANYLFGDRLTLRVPPEDARTAPELLSLSIGQTIEVRGWVSWRDGRASLRLRHPYNVQGR